MTTHFKRDLERTVTAFAQFVEPAIKQALNCVAVKNFERRENELETFLDKHSVDAMAIGRHAELYPLASRVQFGRNYASFSIRRSRPSGQPTEYQKLLESPLPTFHIQSFVNTDEQSAIVGIARTVDVLRQIQLRPWQYRESPNGETFFYTLFSDAGARIFHVNAAGQVYEKKSA